MNWKKLPYWMRGGAIFLIIGILLSAGVEICVQNSSGEFSKLACVPFLIPLFIASIIPANILYLIPVQSLQINLAKSSNEYSLTVLLLGSIGFFIVGIIFGWLYGRIKGRQNYEL